jgi:CRP-like cAMP-binding protein
MQVSTYKTQLPSGRPIPPLDTLDLLEQFGTTMRLSREQDVHGQGDAAEYCYRVISGCVRTVRLVEDGRRQVGEFLLPGDMFGLDVLDTRDGWWKRWRKAARLWRAGCARWHSGTCATRMSA